MNKNEIERKFLVSPSLDLNSLNILKKKRITQGYIYIDKFTEVRVRCIETEDSTEYCYTVKTSEKSLLVRSENEFEITEEVFNQLIEKVMPGTNTIIKDRYIIPLPNDLVAELDIFYGELEGLQMVEVEFPSEEEANTFVKPEWFSVDVTTCKQYKNKQLAKSSRNIPKILKREVPKK